MEDSTPLRTRDVLYNGRTEAMCLHYKVKKGEETIQYVDVMSLYRGYAIISSPRMSSHDSSGVRGRTGNARKRTGAVHSAASAESVSPCAAVHVRWPSDILFLEDVCRVKTVPPREGIGEGYDSHLGRG